MWGIEFWAQNLFNKNYKQVAFDAPLQGSCTERGAQTDLHCVLPGTGFPNRATQLFGAFLGEPRTFGMTLEANSVPRARSRSHRRWSSRRRRRRRRRPRPAPTER